MASLGTMRANCAPRSPPERSPNRYSLTGGREPQLTLRSATSTRRGRMRKRPGSSITPPLRWPSLGTYVVPRNLRTDGPHAGTWRILFEVPARLRPSGWPPTISLPRAEPYCKGPNDLRALVRIQDDAATLLAELRAERGEAPPATVIVGSIPWAIAELGGERLVQAVRGEIPVVEAATDPGECSEEWGDLEASSRVPYIRCLRYILGWSELNCHRHMRATKRPEVEAFLAKWKAKRVQRRRLRDLLVKLFRIALLAREITASPMDEIPAEKKRKRQKGGRRTRVETYSRATVEAYARIARTERAWRNGRGGRTALPWPGGSTLVQLMYQTAADSYDVISWRKGEGGHFVDDPNMPGIDFDRGKTGNATFIPISRALADEIRANGSIYLVTDPQGRPYEPTIDDAKLRGHLNTLRDYAVAAGEQRIVWDRLRHTAATEAVESGVDIGKVKSLTAHVDNTMNRKVYVQQRKEETVEIQRARGIIE